MERTRRRGWVVLLFGAAAVAISLLASWVLREPVVPAALRVATIACAFAALYLSPRTRARPERSPAAVERRVGAWRTVAVIGAATTLLVIAFNVLGWSAKMPLGAWVAIVAAGVMTPFVALLFIVNAIPAADPRRRAMALWLLVYPLAALVLLIPRMNAA